MKCFRCAPLNDKKENKKKKKFETDFFENNQQRKKKKKYIRYTLVFTVPFFALLLAQLLLLASWSVATPRWLVGHCWLSLLLLALWSRVMVCQWEKGSLCRVECLHGGEEGCLKNLCWWSLNFRQRWRWNPTFLRWVSPLCFWYLFLLVLRYFVSSF